MNTQILPTQYRLDGFLNLGGAISILSPRRMVLRSTYNAAACSM